MLNHASPCVPAIAVGFLMHRGASRASKTVDGEASIDASGRVRLKADRFVKYDRLRCWKLLLLLYFSPYLDLHRHLPAPLV